MYLRPPEKLTWYVYAGALLRFHDDDDDEDDLPVNPNPRARPMLEPRSQSFAIDGWIDARGRQWRIWAPRCARRIQSTIHPSIHPSIHPRVARRTNASAELCAKIVTTRNETTRRSTVDRARFERRHTRVASSVTERTTHRNDDDARSTSTTRARRRRRALDDDSLDDDFVGRRLRRSTQENVNSQIIFASAWAESVVVRAQKTVRRRARIRTHLTGETFNNGTRNTEHG